MIQLVILLTSLAAMAEAPPETHPPLQVLEGAGVISSAPRDDRDKTLFFLGGMLRKTDEDTYRRLINTGSDPSKIPGPEQIYSAVEREDKSFEAKPLFALDGFHVNDPSSLRSGTGQLLLYFTRGENKRAEACQKKGETLRSCEGYAAAREIGLALSDDDGKTFKFQEVVVKAAGSGDGAGAAQPSALSTGKEIWLYYTTGMQNFMKENLFRLRLSPDGRKRLSDPEPVKIQGFEPGLALENPQLVRLKCDEGNKFVVTMVANPRTLNSLPLYLSEDGLNFRLVVKTLAEFSGKNLASPTQLPGPASVQECNSGDMKGALTYRDLLFSELQPGGVWSLKRVKLLVPLP